MKHVALALVLAFALAGCANSVGNGPLGGTPSPTAPPPVGPPLTFGGVLKDAATGEPVTNASVRLDLAQTLPCGRQGIGWTSWSLAFDEGRFGPLEVPRPRSDDVAFFLHARAPGYTSNATFIGPTQANEGVGDLAVLLHPNATISGSAPPGTLVALDAPIFPRVTLAAANGTYAFPNARVVDAWLVAGTDTPFRALARAPATVDVPPVEARGWTLEGTVKGPSGAPLAADVVAWNGTQLVGVARASETGVFAMALAPEPAVLRIEARTSDNHYGGVLSLDLKGPPALRETVLAKALC